MSNSVEIFAKMTEMIESGNAASITFSVNMELANGRIEQLESENQKLRAANEVLQKVVEENCCIDDCGFDVREEPREILESCMINNDFMGRKALESADKIMKGD